jgi:general secretion pathway protein H
MTSGGYTMVELLVVLAIVGLLTVVAVPMLSASRPGLEATAAARTLASDLRAARQAAIDSGQARPVVLRPPGGYNTGHVVRSLPRTVTLTFHGPMHDEIDFYSDGSASGGTIDLAAGKARRRVTVRWPSGQIALDE